MADSFQCMTKPTTIKKKKKEKRKKNKPSNTQVLVSKWHFQSKEPGLSGKGADSKFGAWNIQDDPETCVRLERQ